MKTITVKTYLPDGTECGTMQINLKNAAVLWGIREFKKFLKTVVNPYATNECEDIKAELAAGLLEIMQYWAETEINVIISEKGLTAVKALLGGDYKKANALGIGNKDLKQFEKWESMLELTSLETLEAWKEWRKQKIEKVTKANQAEFENFVKQCEQIEETTEEPTPENLKGECTMTNTEKYLSQFTGVKLERIKSVLGKSHTYEKYGRLTNAEYIERIVTDCPDAAVEVKHFTGKDGKPQKKATYCLYPNDTEDKIFIEITKIESDFFAFLRGEFNMKETTTNTAVQEVQATAETELTAEQIEMLKFHGLKQNAESMQFVQDMGLESECYAAVKNLKSVANNGADILAFFRHYSMSYGSIEPTEYKYFAYYVSYKKGSYYKMPKSAIKSSACEIVFKVVSNSGKSVTIQTFEKYNGTITENTYKNKKLNPGSHGLNMYCRNGKIYHDFSDSEGATENVTVDCFNIKAVSRWCKDCSLYVSNCTEITAEDFEAWKADKGTATSNGNQQKRKEAHELDFTPVFYPVSEELARRHKEMISFDDYKQGKVTAEYQAQVSEVFELCRTSSDPEKSLYIADLYSKKLARWYDDFNRNGASCPSVLICGAGNFPTRKKEKQNARYDTLMRQYTAIQGMKSKIKHPHGYEIRRATITAEEFENVLYFETVINETENRIQLVFNGKPEEEERNILKKNGFRWSPRFKAWQRQLTENAVAAVWNVVNAFDRLEEAEAETTAKEIESAKEEQKQKQQDMQGELVDLTEKLDSYYDRLYEGDASLTAFEKVACAAGDEFIKNNPDYTGLVANFRGDYISSDRETAAFAFALAEMGKIPAIIPAEPEQETAKLNNIDLSPLPCLDGENIPNFVPNSYTALYSTARALKENTDNSEDVKYFREQISRILKKYIADAESVLAVYGAEALEIFEYAEIFNGFIYGELSEEISTAKEKGLKIFAEYHAEPEQEETTTKEFDWGTVEFEEIDGLPNPETLDLTESTAEPTEPEQEEPAQPETITMKESDILDVLACLDRAKVKCTSAFYRGALKIMKRLLTNATGKKLYYDSIKRKHCFDGMPADTHPTDTQQTEPAETMPAQAEAPTEAHAEPEKQEFSEDDTKRFEAGKIYGTASICDSNCIFKFEVVKRSKHFVWLKDIHGDTTRRKIETRQYTENGYLKQEKCFPLGQYSMSPTLYATDILQAEPETEPKKPTITQTINSDYAAEYVPF